MAIETEKKYRVSSEQRDAVIEALKEMEAEFIGEDFETNLIFGGGILEEQESVLRIRKTSAKNTLTYKRNVSAAGGIKHHIEHETEIADAEAMQKIAEAMDLFVGLIYEKKRQTWKLRGVEVVIDELPFGLFMEIEGTISQIGQTEMLLDIEDLEVEQRTYPFLTFHLGKKNGERIEALFENEDSGV